MIDTAQKNQVKCKLRKGDEVIVVVGRSKGKTGKIERINRKNLKVHVSGVNIFKKHIKADPEHPQGTIADKNMPVHISNLMLVDPKTKKPTRVGYRILEGKKVRVAKASGTVL